MTELIGFGRIPAHYVLLRLVAASIIPNREEAALAAYDLPGRHFRTLIILDDDINMVRPCTRESGGALPCTRRHGAGAPGEK